MLKPLKRTTLYKQNSKKSLTNLRKIPNYGRKCDNYYGLRLHRKLKTNFAQIKGIRDLPLEYWKFKISEKFECRTDKLTIAQIIAECVFYTYQRNFRGRHKLNELTVKWLE